MTVQVIMMKMMIVVDVLLYILDEYLHESVHGHVMLHENVPDHEMMIMTMMR